MRIFYKGISKIFNLASKMAEHAQNQIWFFNFNCYDDFTSGYYQGLFHMLESRYDLANLFTQEEIDLIINNIDNRDYIQSMYPNANVRGLYVDSSIFEAILKYKKENGNPKLLRIRELLTYIYQLPIHRYALEFNIGPENAMQYISRDVNLSNLHVDNRN